MNSENSTLRWILPSLRKREKIFLQLRFARAQVSLRKSQCHTSCCTPIAVRTCYDWNSTLQAKAEQPDLCSCLLNKPKPAGRKEKFVAAIRNYDWDAAQLLAVGDDERQDLEDSKNRVAWMLHYTAEGKKEEVRGRASRVVVVCSLHVCVLRKCGTHWQALALAITDEEKAEIENK